MPALKRPFSCRRAPVVCNFGIPVRRLQLEAERADIAAVPILVQVNAAGEAQRSGVEPASAVDVVGELGALGRLDVRGLIRRLCVEAGDRSGIYPLKREMLLVVPVLAQTPDGLSTDHVGMLCRENLLVTWHQEFALNPSQHAALHEAEAWLPNRSIAGLVSALLVDLSQEGLRHTVTLRRLVRALEERMDRDPDAVEAVLRELAH